MKTWKLIFIDDVYLLWQSDIVHTKKMCENVIFIIDSFFLTDRSLLLYNDKIRNVFTFASLPTLFVLLCLPGAGSGGAPGGKRTWTKTDEEEPGRERGRYRSGESHFRSEHHFIYLFIFLSVLTPSARHLQVFEGKQRLWEKEVEELKRLYAAKLRQVSQHAQRSQRSMQLELFRAQQEKNRLQEELDGLKRDAVRDVTAVPKPTSPTLEETRWEVRRVQA